MEAEHTSGRLSLQATLASNIVYTHLEAVPHGVYTARDASVGVQCKLSCAINPRCELSRDNVLHNSV
jgi:hypothetical protein